MWALMMWALMCVAMMLPAAVPALAHVGTNSLRWRRQRAMATFAAVYLAVWIGYGALLLAPAPLWARLPHDVTLACALALAAAWQLTVHKRRALRDCHRSSPLPPSGRRAVAGTVRFGLRQGGECLRSCWALLLVMAVASGRSGMLVWMAFLTGIVLTERPARKPRRPTRLAAAVLAAAALAVVLPDAAWWWR
ncbi:copper chaperone [Streptomyces sp. NPDC054945]